VTSVIPGYTQRIKTAISLSDDTFRRVEDGAAAEYYLGQLNSEALSSRLDEALARIGTDDDGVGAFGLQRLEQLTEGDEW